MLGMLAAPLAEFFQLQPVLESFFILIRIVIGALAHGAFEFDEVVLGHMKDGGIRLKEEVC